MTEPDADTLPLPASQVVELSQMEMLTASFVGVIRQLTAIKAGKPDQHGVSAEDGFKVHILGAMGEMAVAKVMGVYNPLSLNTFKVGGDIGGSVQVRTRSRDDYDLIVRKDDRDSDRFVLVVGTPPALKVCGWISGRDAKQKRFLANHGGRGECWFVPQHELRPMTDGELREAA